MTSKYITIPLFNFELTDLDVLELSKAKIVRANKAEIKKIESLFEYSLPYSFNVEISPFESEKPIRTIDRVLIVLKLFKDGFIFSNLFRQNDNQTYRQIPHYTPWGLERGGIYSISKVEASSFIDFWEKYITINLQNFAVNRFHLADYRAYTPDRFFDYALSLEHLLVPSSKEGEISYKFRIAGTRVLGATDNISKECRLKKLKSVYGLRSNIVHGVKIVHKGNKDNHFKTLSSTKNAADDKEEKDQWKDAISLVRNYSREAIRMFYEKGLLDNSNKRRQWIEGKIINPECGIICNQNAPS